MLNTILEMLIEDDGSSSNPLTCTRDNSDGSICHCKAGAGYYGIAKCERGEGDPYDPYIDSDKVKKYSGNKH